MFLVSDLAVIARQHTPMKKDYLQTHWDIFDGKIALNGQIGSQDIDNPAIIPPVFIGKDCRISGDAQVGPYVVLGNNCQVGNDAMIKHSICWDGATIGNGATVHQSIIGSSSMVGDEIKVDGESLVNNKIN